MAYEALVQNKLKREHITRKVYSSRLCSPISTLTPTHSAGPVSRDGMLLRRPSRLRTLVHRLSFRRHQVQDPNRRVPISARQAEISRSYRLRPQDHGDAGYSRILQRSYTYPY